DAARPWLRQAQVRSRFTRRVGTPRRFLMSTKHVIARNLAAAFLSGPWSPGEMLRRGGQTCGRRERWLRPLIRRLLAAFDGSPARRTQEAVATFIDADAGFIKEWDQHGEELLSPPRQIFWVT